MASQVRRRWRSSRWIRLVGLTVAIGLGVAASKALPHLAQLPPTPIRWLLRDCIPFALLLGVGVFLTRRPGRILFLPVATERWDRLDDRASWLLRGWLSAALIVACLLMLVAWIPHYLTWPWWTDTDHFAVSAQSWDRGILPYRDLLDFNFPGPMYVFWVLGKVFGWGRTAPIYAVDAFLLVLLGAALWYWSRRRFDRALPGLVGYLVFLTYYLNLDYAQVAQRDWQGPLLAVLGLVILEVRPGRVGRVLSAFAFAAALVFRPHAVLFFPAMVSAIDENARRPDEPWRITIRALVEWGLFFAFGMLLAFAPLLLAGIADDLARSFRSAWYGEHYERLDQTSVATHLIHDLARWETSGGLTVLALLAVRAGPPLRRMARTWVLALLFVLFYKPISPVVFLYHNHPLNLVCSIVIALIVGGILSERWLIPTVEVLALAVVLYASVSGLPANCSFQRSVQAVPTLLRGVEPTRAPLGCEAVLPNAGKRRARYSWEDYCAVLDYLRKTTDSRTRVANYLHHYPWPAVNGPVGRLTAYPCAEGFQWLRGVAPSLEGRFAQALAQPDDAVVIWVPIETGVGPEVGLEGLERAIRRFYQPEARCGALEVWRRTPEDAPVKGKPFQRSQTETLTSPRT